MKSYRYLATLSMIGVFLGAFAAPKPLPNFKLAASDGHEYSDRTLSKGKPVFLMFFAAGCPHNEGGIKDMNRLARLVGSKVRIVGMTNLSPKQTATFASNHHAAFPVLADPHASVIAAIGGQAGLDNALITPNGQVVKVWNGYNRSTLKQLERELKSSGFATLDIALDQFPKDRHIGCAIVMDRP